MRRLAPYIVALAVGFGVALRVQGADFESFRLKLPSVATVSTALRDSTLVSVMGRDFELFRFQPAGKRTPAKHRFLIQGGLHGNETQASVFVSWLSRRFARGESLLNTLPLDDVSIDFLPNANPDGAAAGTRYNERGVNLNRNFGVLWGVTRENPGVASFSEPETKAIRRLFKERRYTAAVDVHGYINWVVSPSALQNQHPKLAKRYVAWKAALTREMAVLPGYELKTGATLGDGGAFEDWAFWSEGTMAYCLELESLQRFERPYRRDFADLTKDNDGPTIDTFKRYEAFVHRMFTRSIEIRAEEGAPERLTAN